LSRLLLLLWLLFIVLPLSSTAVATENATVIYANDNKPPKCWVENGKPRGILIDILAWISLQSGHKFQVDLYPWKRTYSMGLAGQGGIVGLSMNAERLKLFDYSKPLFYDDVMLVVLKGGEFSYAELEDLRGKRLAIGRGTAFGGEFDRGKQRGIFTIVETNNPAQGYHLMRDGQVDAVLIGPGRRGVKMVFEGDPKLAAFVDEYVVLPIPLVRDPNYLGFAKSMNKKKFLEDVDRWIH